ncbi:hypothetical protein DRB96_41775 [Streptomyces sp. ICC1]|nr:hypothetical protein DRB96_41775 [Streptomyces sp. ICC1]
MAHVLVIGGGIGGLATALLAARRGHTVELFERDARAPGTALDRDFFGWRRPAVPQAGHPHALLGAARNLLRDELPDVHAEMLRLGARERHELDWFDVRPPARPGDEDLVMLQARRIVLESALATALRAEPGVVARYGEPVTGLLTAGSGGSGGSGGGRGRSRGLAHGRGQQVRVECAEGGARGGAQAAGQVAADLVVGGQCLRRAARVAQGADPQGLQRLVQRQPRAQRGQLGQGPFRLSQRQRGLQPAPAGLAPQRLPAGGLRLRPGQGAQRLAAPQGEGLVVQGGRVRRGGRGGRGRRAREPLEAVQVDVVAGAGEHVAALPRPHRLVPERPPQPSHQRLEGGRAVGRRVAVPDLGDERARRHRPPGPQRERGQERAQARPADGDGAPVVADGLGGAENRIAHRSIVSGPGTSTAPAPG